MTTSASGDVVTATSTLPVRPQTCAVRASCLLGTYNSPLLLAAEVGDDGDDLADFIVSKPGRDYAQLFKKGNHLGRVRGGAAKRPKLEEAEEDEEEDEEDEMEDEE